MFNTLQAVSDIFFPPSCLSCKIKITQSDILFCEACLSRVQLLKEPYCPGCGKLFDSCSGKNHYCSGCLKNIWHFSKASSFFLYHEPISGLIHSLKYQGNTGSLSTLNRIARSLFRLPLVDKAEIIVPVPLHAKRLRQRGFNQSVLIARSLFSGKKTSINPMVLQKQRWTEPQTFFNGMDRRKNLHNAFAVTSPSLIKGKKVLLVDDVFTTGTTVNECARVLKKNGAAEVFVFTLARVAG
jgi:ComF family protein